ncbi:hypothetical protein V502_01463 [Pseudogymnoascus sp. VKM F-4520 (FW-2644)]|nr:hypothetical protein V502_01463 [Pseudogymnoascus sp. VKM F-4520 (FW-2644)]
MSFISAIGLFKPKDKVIFRIPQVTRDKFSLAPFSWMPTSIPTHLHVILTPPKYPSVHRSLLANIIHTALIMRLLKLVGDEFSFVQAPTHNNLNYAILSHTWIPDQEVTYQELASGGGKTKGGYEKIRFCGKQAMNDGLLYFWVDTCCIDKSDPAELSTAINSMFRWYRKATKCYVYLEDVSTPNSDADTPAHQGTWEAAFRASKWFTRGWTLQELIAPLTVEFFSKDGKQLGNKQSLEGLIYDVTKIPIKALQGNPFSDFSTTERQGWAAERQTTKEEDLVYCLLGLCEVSMSAIYGEGRKNALKRFQMTVRGFSNTSELKALENIFIVPFDRNPNFTGRESQLAKLEEKFFEKGQTTKVAVTGLGGVGKTQVTLAFVYQMKNKHPNCSVIWIPATNLESLYQAYQDVARQLCIPGWEEDKADVKRLVQSHLSKESSGQWLLVFDNADDSELWFAKTAGQGGSRLVDYLPRSKHGCILFTTRDRKTAVKLAQKNVVDVPEMDEDAATHLLQNSLVNPDLVHHKSDTIVLLKELTFLPLAIVQAAAYINENGVALSEYLSLLRDQEEEVIDLLSEDFEDERRYHDVKNPVATTWLISFEQIQRRDPLAADYLSLMACVDSKNIPQSLLPAGPSRKKEIDAVGTLDAYSFITKHSIDLAFDLHRLVHLATRNWLRKQELIVHWSEKAITQLEEVFPDEDHQNRGVWRTYLPHVQFVLSSDVVDKEGADRMRLGWRPGASIHADQHGEPGLDILEPGSLEGGRGLGIAGDGDEEEGVEPRASRHADEHGEPGHDIPGARPLEGSRGLESGSDGDDEECARPGASRHADQHEQPSLDILEPGPLEGGRGFGSAGDGDEEEGAGPRASFHANQHGQSGLDIPEPGPLEGG